MKIENKGQESNRTIASGFFVLRDKLGNLIGQTVAMNQNKQFTTGEDLTFHPCQAVQKDLAVDNIIMPFQKSGRTGYMFDASKVQFANAVQPERTQAAATTTVEQHRENMTK